MRTRAAIGPAPSVRAVPRPPGALLASGHSWTSPPATWFLPCRQRSVPSPAKILAWCTVCYCRVSRRRSRRLRVLPSPEALRAAFLGSGIPGGRPCTIIPLSMASSQRVAWHWTAAPGSRAQNVSSSRYASSVAYCDAPACPRCGRQPPRRASACRGSASAGRRPRPGAHSSRPGSRRSGWSMPSRHCPGRSAFSATWPAIPIVWPAPIGGSWPVPRARGPSDGRMTNTASASAS